MLRLFRAPRPVARRPRLGVEFLEARDCPAGWDVPFPPAPVEAGEPADGPHQVETSSALPPGESNRAPRIEEFDAASLGNGVYTFTGRVNDESANGMVVTFHGVPGMEGRTATCNADGVFSVTVILATDGSDTGVVWVEGTDPAGQGSNRPEVSINPRG